MKYTLFIGRWQPFHAGHQKLIGVVLDEGKPVCIAIRDTPIDEKNPYTAEVRTAMIRAVYPAERYPQVKVITIPDIEDVVFGRDVGWGIREIRLDAAMEAISATAIRAEECRTKGCLSPLHAPTCSQFVGPVELGVDDGA
jgi:cytidyltransferase-like protein